MSNRNTTDVQDRAAFLEGIGAHRNIIHKVGWVYGRDAADREDLEQEILLQLWRSRGSFDGKAAFSTWMYRVALNTAITFRRRLRPTEPLDREPHIPGQQAEQAMLAEELRELYGAIARLSAVEKALILMWLDERSYEEIAATLGISVKNVSVRLVRTRAKLARMIGDTEDPR
ncbi:MAG: RNA polymerase sigma factor [Xanthomonadales bacterium]